MSARKGVTIVLLLFVAVSVVYLIAGDSMRGRTISSDEEDSAANQARAPVTELGDAAGISHTVIVYYFHGNRRCQTCRTIEAYTEEAVKAGFPEELGSGRVEWRVVNVDQPENQHFIDDFELSTRTVVLVDIRNGEPQRWMKLEKVWELVHQPKDFHDYIQGNLVDFLEESHG